MGMMLGWLIVIALLTLAALELGRYRRARRNPEEFPYPRPRLIRRITISAIFNGVMLLVIYWPKARPLVQFSLLFFMLAGLILGFALLVRDMRETSQAVLDHANTLSRQTGESLRALLDKKRDGK